MVSGMFVFYINIHILTNPMIVESSTGLGVKVNASGKISFVLFSSLQLYACIIPSRTYSDFHTLKNKMPTISLLDFDVCTDHFILTFSMLMLL